MKVYTKAIKKGGSNIEKKTVSYFLPSYLDHTHFQYLHVDNQYIASIQIGDYPPKTAFLSVLDIIPKDVSYDCCMRVAKQDTAQVLKKLTYSISSASTEIKTIHENQVDVDILGKIKEDAKALRRQIQLHNEEVFFVHMIFTFYAASPTKLWKILKTFQSKLYTKQFYSTITNFRHLDFYLATLPVGDIQPSLWKKGYRNMTTSQLTNLFPFYTKTIFDKNGILFGYTMGENKLCHIDLFHAKYFNANMCVLGSSGSGKSYFAKLMILRHFWKGHFQYIFDPEEEYVDIVDNLGGIYLNLASDSGKYLNILEITEYESEGDFLSRKIEEITGLLTTLMEEEGEKDKDKLKEAVYKSYQEKGITEQKESLYQKSNEYTIQIQRSFKKPSEFPTLETVVSYIKSKKLALTLREKVLQKFPILTKTTNISSSNLICFGLRQLSYRHTNIFLSYFLKKIEQSLKFSLKHHTILYLDEIWKYIAIHEKYNLAENIYTLFKTIRKQNASMVAITQDISDFFSLDQGNYGKSILNNCGFKMFFKMEYSDYDILKNCHILEKETLEHMHSLDKGQAILTLRNDTIGIQIKANTYEHGLIEGGNNENISSITEPRLETEIR